MPRASELNVLKTHPTHVAALYGRGWRYLVVLRSDTDPERGANGDVLSCHRTMLAAEAKAREGGPVAEVLSIHGAARLSWEHQRRGGSTRGAPIVWDECLRLLTVDTYEAAR